jgi:hypothetical protein
MVQLLDERYNAAWWTRTARTAGIPCLGCGRRVPAVQPCAHCAVRAANRRIAAQKTRGAA